MTPPDPRTTVGDRAVTGHTSPVPYARHAFAPERPGFIPWSHPAAAGLGVGIALAGTGLPAWWLLGCLAACRWRMGIGLIALGFGCLGWANMQRWQARADPLAGMHGEELTVTGNSDGRVLRLTGPVRGAVALAPAGVVPVGRVTVRGNLEHAPGKRNPGGFDYAGWLARRNVTGQLFVDAVLDHAPSWDPRGRLRQAVTRGLGPREGALVAAMTLGVRDELGDLRETFASAGLAHVLALSGLHVGVLMLALAAMLKPLGARRYPVMLLVLAGFVLLVGPSPSVVRAGAMVGAGLVTMWRGAGRMEPWTSLGLAAVVTLLWRPAWLFDVSFQLSYLAVLGLLVFMGPALRSLRADGTPWWHPRTLVLGGAAVTVASQLPMASLLLASFGEIPMFSPVANIVAIPLATALVPLGFAAAVLGAIWAPLAGLVNLVTQPLAWSIIAWAELASTWPALTWGEIRPGDHAVYGVAVAALAWHVHGRLRLWRVALVWAAALGFAAIPPILPEVVFLDVGQGDATLIRLPGRVEILIDAGGSPFSDFDTGSRIVLPALRALGVDELELVVATHPDTDHIEGLGAVFRGVPVQQLVIGHAAPGVAAWESLMVAADDAGTDIRAVRRGERIVIGEATFEVLHPTATSSGAANEDSVALLFRWKDRPAALFLGDVSMAVERELAVPPVPVMMVAHHGSRHSTSIELLRAARPELAVISVGRNSFGHPATGVLERLASFSVAVRTTQNRGAVRVSVPDMLFP